jgi:septal ring-binding cell division protein DamX
LECGAAVGTRIAGPRGWRASVAVVGVLLALALIAVILAIVELAGPAETVTEVPQTPTPAPSAVAPTATASPSVDATSTPSPTASPDGGTVSPALEPWPKGRTAWTVVLNSSGTRADAERIAGELAAKGVTNIGVLDSNDFESLGPDSFVVFTGTYPNRAAADAALAQVRDRAGGGSTRRIVPK